MNDCHFKDILNSPGLSGNVFSENNDYLQPCALTCFVYEQIRLTEGCNYTSAPPDDNQVFGA